MSFVVVLPTEPVTRDDGKRGRPAHVAREVGEALRGVRHPHQGKADGRLRVALDEGGAGAPPRGLGEEVVPVEPRAPDRHEESARRDRPRVDRDPGEGDLARHGGRRASRRCRRARPRGGGPPAAPPRSPLPPAPARRARTSRATWRSSKGTVRSRTTWYASWPLPAITTTTPSRPISSARAMASRRSGTTRVSPAFDGGIPRRISSRMASGGSLRGLSEVRMTTSESRAATAPISGRLLRSRSPPQPNTVTTRRGLSPRTVSSRFLSASSVCA